MYRLISGIILLFTVSLLSSCGPKHKGGDEHYLKGNDLVLYGQLDSAKAEYLAALKVDSANWKVCYQLAGVYEMQGDFLDAYNYFSKALRLNPDFAMGYYARATLEETIGDEKGADRDLRMVSTKKPFYMAYLAMGRKHYAAGHLPRAIAYLDSAIALNPDFYIAYSMRGSCKFKQGDTSGAIRDFNREIELSPRHLMGYANRAVAYGAMKNFRAAINDMNTALAIDPMWTQAYIYRGLFYNQMGVKDSSCGDFRMAYKLKDPSAESYMKQYCK